MRASYKYNKKYPEKIRAHVAVRRALKRGDLTRPNKCSRCGNVGDIEGHHRDYDKPLDVEWLCIPCHGVETENRKGEKHWKSRFTEQDVRDIRALHESGMGARKIGKIYGCDPTTVARVFRRQTWNHVV